MGKRAGKVEGSPGNQFVQSGARKRAGRSGSTATPSFKRLQWWPAGGVLIPVDLAGEKLGRGLGKMEELTTNPFVRSI